MKILGFQTGHDVAYAVLENGIPIIHEELERFTREKEPLGDGLKMAFRNLSPNILEDISHFTLGNWGHYQPQGIEQWGEICYDPATVSKMQEIAKNNGGKFHEFGHHLSHAANAFFSSNFRESLILTIDGGGKEDNGDLYNATTWVGLENKIHPINKYLDTFPNIGVAWSDCTKYIFGLSSGYPLGNQAGTVMAMACMGDPDKYLSQFRSLFRLDVDSRIGGVDIVKLRELAESDEKERFDIAASLQKATEQLIKCILDQHMHTKVKNLCLSGGVILNSVMVGKLYEWYPQLEEIYVCPVPSDSGLAIGSAQYLWHHILENPRIKWEDNATPYLGRKYSNEEVKSALQKNTNIKYRESSDQEVVDILSKNNNIVSVFSGGSESGRRALGNISILADPRSPDMKDIINKKVKHRQWFRPFAPSILREKVSEWFERDVDSPYMSTVLKFKEEVRDSVPAVVHFDGTGRVQTVTQKDNEWYYNLIARFNEKTGVPILLNTSFNDREPIVETPEHAINCFLGTDIDYLYFADLNILVEKNNE